jgi:hypothetical protein
MLKKQKMAGKLASWFMVVAMMVALVGCGKDVPSTPDTTPTTPVVETDVDTNVDVDTDTNVDVDVDVDADANANVEPVVEPTQAIYEGLTPGGTGYELMITEDYNVNGLCAKFVPIDKNERAAFIGYVGNVIDDGGDYYGAKKSLDDPDDISIYTAAIENVQYAVYFEAPIDYFTGTPNVANEAIGGYNIKATSGSNYTDLISIRAFSIDVANKYLNEWKDFDNSKDIVATWTSTDGFKEYSFEKEDGKIVFLVSYEINGRRVFYYDFISNDESLFINDYTVSLSVPLDFSEEDALAIINSVKFMEKDEADELYISLLRQTESNEYFDPTTIE